MNKKLYYAIGIIPGFGRIIQNRISFFGMHCSMFMDDFTRTEEYKVLIKWMKEHPNEVLTHKIAKQLMDTIRK